MAANPSLHRVARALTIVILTFSTSVFAQSPNFSSLPCPQRVSALLDFWVNEKQKPGRTPCERARLEVTIQRDLNTTALACPDDLTTIPSTLASYESTMNRVCSSKTNAPSQPAISNNCPTTVLNPAGVPTSVLDPIKAEGNAQRALQTARDQLRYITDQGSCDSFANRQECDSAKKSWRDLVSALECHAQAERNAPAQAAATPISSPVKPAMANPSSQAPGKPQGKADDFLAFADPSGAAKAPTGASPPGTSSVSAKSFLPFAEKGTGGEESGAFPTPHCRFISDSAEQHDATRLVCVDEVVWECQNRASPDPKKAWWRQSLTKNGCGSVRTIEAIERDRKQLKRATKGWGIYE